ncbi:ATP-binding protein [Actinomycetaceae bacterium WB03_NA08]|uniref:ATP-binding protein n=1 Tax=Scrofimicrobium canadense TaxID=2652290 RepID=A0A6N7W1W4_9ACTO|nr:ATP-binding protein [Scrofimicrobium canadense]MSS83381.1 ATP-binding protein [Scrofimicrobium canadense]
MSGVQSELFELPEGSYRPRARVILLTGPSGSGKTSLSKRTGLPSVALDSFYRNDDAPGMPMRGDLIDWDDVNSWDRQGALETLSELCTEGTAEIPIYDIPSNRRTGTAPLSLGDNKLFIAEGIFASSLIEPLRQRQLLAAAICVARSPLRNAYFRLLRDLSESRKPVPVLLFRGARLAAAEPSQVRAWIGAGCQPVKSLDAAASLIRELNR